jgi:hypothetical protein
MRAYVRDIRHLGMVQLVMLPRSIPLMYELSSVLSNLATLITQKSEQA